MVNIVRYPICGRMMTLATVAFVAVLSARAERRISVAEYKDKVKAGWIGQMAGVAYGAPTEFNWRDKIIPNEKLPPWSPEKILGAFEQDDLYVEIGFLATLDRCGLDVSSCEAGIDFANTKFSLWAANLFGRENIRRGIPPPDSSHPQYSPRGNDIDYQIEADYAGLISPGCPQQVICLGNTFGRLMNYGDGLWAGQFVGALYAEAFFETNRVTVVEKALKTIPDESDYAEMVRDILGRYRLNRNDWMGTWQVANEKWRGRTKRIVRDANDVIDVRINGAMVLIGYLYGGGDFARTLEIATRCGYDSDCNPSSACGVLCTSSGVSFIPVQYRSALPESGRRFAHTDFDFAKLLEVSEKLARQVVVRSGGRIEKDAQGMDWMVVPESNPRPNAYEPTWAPGPVMNVKFTGQDRERILCGPHPHVMRYIQDACFSHNVRKLDLVPGVYTLERYAKDLPAPGTLRWAWGPLEIDCHGAVLIAPGSGPALCFQNCKNLVFKNAVIRRESMEGPGVAYDSCEDVRLENVVFEKADVVEKVFHVDPSYGRCNGDGTSESPFRSLEDAQEAVRRLHDRDECALSRIVVHKE